MHAGLTILSLLLILPGWIDGTDFISPCPDIFKYDNISPKHRKWFGTLYLFATRKPTAVTSIRILLDNPAADLSLYNHVQLLQKWQGRIESFDNTEFLVQDPNVVVKPGVKLPLRFFVVFPSVGPIPRLIAVRVNEVTVCSGTLSLGLDGEYVPRPQIEQISTTETPVQIWSRWPIIGGSLNNQFNLNNAQECGTTVTNVSPLILNGEVSTHGQWPWHGALYFGNTLGLTYRCGMTLITLQHVLTAAHCVTVDQHSTEPIELDALLMYFGKTLLSQRHSAHIQNAQPDKLIIHPDYNSKNLHNDIAIIHLKEPLRITDSVRPICLGKASDFIPIVDLINQTGTVVGWGITKSGELSDVLQHADIPVIDSLTCIYSDTLFYSQYSSPKSFCAGASACNGDSGGGLVLRSKDTKLWYIRGIVSLSAVDYKTGLCDANHYAVFTDVPLYLDWINKEIGR